MPSFGLRCQQRGYGGGWLGERRHGEKCANRLAVGVNSGHSQAMGEPVRRSTLGADGCETGLLRHEKAVYTSYTHLSLCGLDFPGGFDDMGRVGGVCRVR
jgi:hypothetical protein